MLTKPSNTPTPIIVNSAGTISTSPREIVSIHFVNTTAGAGKVTIHDGSGNKGVVLGSDAAGGADDWTPTQPAYFERVIVEFTTGTGHVIIQTN